jgi:prolyl-tRNA editing enzyme YbaK/EbsC (Cys-tRNA(Pro) deacylase)
MHANTRHVSQTATSLGLDIELKAFPEGTKTAVQAAEAIGVVVGQIVKSLIFAVGDKSDQVSGEIVVALMPGHLQLDERKLAAAAGKPACWRVDADAVRAATGFPIGGVAPIGHRNALRIFADPELLAFETVWAAAGTWNDVFGVAPKSLLEAAGAIVVDLHRPSPVTDR